MQLELKPRIDIILQITLNTNAKPLGTGKNFCWSMNGQGILNLRMEQFKDGVGQVTHQGHSLKLSRHLRTREDIYPVILADFIFLNVLSEKGS